jgi:hypothetical protein
MLARPYCKSWLERDSSHQNNHDNEPWDGDAGENAGVGDGHGDEVEDESRTSYLKVPGAARVYGHIGSDWEQLKSSTNFNSANPYYPFANEDEWGLSRWLILAGLSHAKINEFLNLSYVSAVLYE